MWQSGHDITFLPLKEKWKRRDLCKINVPKLILWRFIKEISDLIVSPGHIAINSDVNL